MSPAPLYPKVVAGFEPDDRGEDAVKLAELLGQTGDGEVSKVHIDHGSAGRGLQEIAERGEADLIVLGSTHRAAFGAVAPGSVAEHLLAGAPCRVAIAPRGYARARAILAADSAGEEAHDVPAGTPMPMVRDALRVVAVGFDASPQARVALAEAARIAAGAGATMRLIGVTEVAPPGIPTRPLPGATSLAAPTDDLQAAVHDAAGELPAELRALPVHERGEPVEKLLDRAGEGVDLLVLGSRGFGPLQRVLLGSVSARVIRTAPCPVLVIPRSAPPPREGQA